MKHARHLASRLASIVSATLLLAGCESEQEKAQRSERFSNMVRRSVEVFGEMLESDELKSAVRRFRNERGRWPTNYAEVSVYAQSPEHAFELKGFRDVVFTPAEDGGLKLDYLAERSVTLGIQRRSDTNSGAKTTLNDLLKPNK